MLNRVRSERRRVAHRHHSRTPRAAVQDHNCLERLTADESILAAAGPYWLKAARSDSLKDFVVASTAVGSYPQCAMQLSQRGSLPRPYLSQSVVSTSSL